MLLATLEGFSGFEWERLGAWQRWSKYCLLPMLVCTGGIILERCQKNVKKMMRVTKSTAAAKSSNKGDKV